jgi:hypothetical protein
MIEMKPSEIKEIRYCTIIEAITHKGETQYFWIEPDKTKINFSPNGVIGYIGPAPRGPFRTRAEADKDYNAVILPGKKFVDGGKISEAGIDLLLRDGAPDRMQ